jgi:Ca-activated chloride channel family protein
VSFENPRILGALFLIVPLALAMIAHYLRRGRVLLFFEKGGAGGRARAARIRRRYWASSLAFLAFFASIVIALAGPLRGTRLVPDFRRGIDAALAFDLSRSMDVRDAAGGASRLEQAAAIAGSVVSAPESAGIRFAAAAGKGQGVLAVPLTLDIEAVSGFINGIGTARITGRGTDLEKLVDAAALAFKDDFPGKRRIILFSDGESHSGSLADAAGRCLARGVSIIAVGLGTEAGGPVPQAAGEDGQEIISRADRETLRKAAARTGGFYIDGDASAAAYIAERLARNGGAGRAETGFREEPRQARHLFILAALAFFGLSKLLTREFRPKRREQVKEEGGSLPLRPGQGPGLPPLLEQLLTS